LILQFIHYVHNIFSFANSEIPENTIARNLKTT